MNDKLSSVSFTLKTVTAPLALIFLLSRGAPTSFAAPPPNHLSVGALPPDLPLPASPPSQEKWLREANILQPYGHSAFTALTDIKDRPARLKTEFGFNAIIVQPPDSHNTIASAADKLTEKQFVDGIAAYRAAGYRIMLYTSVMALGLSPEFQSGQVSREHPDWLQRDPKGNPVLAWGVPWLCPSTGAREVALDRCLNITRKYNADGIMLDNNEFFSAAAGWTCHCDACTKAFREYIHKRFGDDLSVQLFGQKPFNLQVPTEEGPIYFEWLHWRNRVWAEVNESFRARLRQQNPSILFFANTQYAYDNSMLATDEQYAREDVVLSESCDLNARQMGPKMVIGQSLAQGRPLWNYIGTFAKPDNYTGLRPASQVGPAIVTTLAHHARPWIVDGFDEGPTNAESRALMSKLLGWHATHQNLFQGKPCSVVAAIISTTSRGMREPLIPPHVSGMQNWGIPVVALRDDALTENDLRPFRVITCETARCMPVESVPALAAWVRAGGVLIAGQEAARYDELGRQRPLSPLWKALDLNRPPIEQTTIGRGTAFTPAGFEGTAIGAARPYAFVARPSDGAEVVPYRTESSLMLHVNGREQTGRPIVLRIPNLFTLKSKALLHQPGVEQAKPVPVKTTPDGATIAIDPVPLYCVVEVPLQQDVK